MALLLMKSGKQIVRLSSSAAAVAAKSQQRQLGGVSSKYLFSTLSTRSSCFGAKTFFFSNEFKPTQQDDDIEIPKKTLKSFLTNLFRAPPPPARTPFQELLGKFMDLAEQSKNCPEDRLPSILDDIRPVLKELLDRMSNEGVTRFVYEFARASASSPPVVIDGKVKAMVDKLPTHVIHLFEDMLIDLIKGTYFGGSYRVRFDSNSKSFVLTVDVSRIGKEHLKLFVVKDYLMVTGTDKDAPPAPPQLLALDAKIYNILKMPSCLYSRDELTASILEDKEQGSRQIKIVVPETEVLVADNPRVFQLNLDTQGAHQG